MPTATFDPTTARVDLRSDSSDWVDPTDRVTFQRRTASGAWEILPGCESIPAVGSYALGVDQEMPLDSTITYRALNRSGTPSSEVVVSTSGAEWGLWAKTRRHVSHTQRLMWSGIGDITEDAVGDLHKVFNGATVAQSYGTDAEEVDVTVWTDGQAALRALRALLKADRRVFLQQPDPKELDDGWWWVDRLSISNPDQRTFGSGGDIRFATLSMRRIEAPTGVLGGSSGATYAAIRVAHPTYADITATGHKYWELREGA